MTIASIPRSVRHAVGTGPYPFARHVRPGQDIRGQGRGSIRALNSSRSGSRVNTMADSFPYRPIFDHRKPGNQPELLTRAVVRFSQSKLESNRQR